MWILAVSSLSADRYDILCPFFGKKTLNDILILINGSYLKQSPER